MRNRRWWGMLLMHLQSQNLVERSIKKAFHPRGSTPTPFHHLTPLQPPSQAHILVVVCRALDLVLVDGDAGDVSARGGGNGAHGAAHAAADIQAVLSGGEANEGADAGLVRRLGRRPGVAGEQGGEVEALAPAPLVDVSHLGREKVFLSGKGIEIVQVRVWMSCSQFSSPLAAIRLHRPPWLGTWQAFSKNSTPSNVLGSYDSIQCPCQHIVTPCIFRTVHAPSPSPDSRGTHQGVKLVDKVGDLFAVGDLRTLATLQGVVLAVVRADLGSVEHGGWVITPGSVHHRRQSGRLILLLGKSRLCWFRTQPDRPSCDRVTARPSPHSGPRPPSGCPLPAGRSWVPPGSQSAACGWPGR